MTQISSAGTRFRHSLELEKPLQIVGTINAYCALMAEQAGFQAIYLSGAGVANASFGVPDLGITTINDVVADIQRIVGATQLPLLVDADTGFGHAFSMARTIREFTRAGAAGVHIEDQVAAKRCGHRPGKELVDTAEMVDRIHAAVDARTDESFFIMARTDALASEGMEATLERCHKYVEAGVDGIFAEAVREADQYQKFTQALSVPVLANMTEFGQSPLLTAEQLGDLGIAMVLYPLSAFRAMNAAAERVYSAIRKERTQDTVVDLMQTRDRLYEVLDYHRYEQQIDDLIRKSEK
ncbi:MAG: methylisocitrate lyase [Planctomycetaceae bacterium]|nr:methylisocitrate lyase [Planctomycetaceae bacterium]